MKKRAGQIRRGQGDVTNEVRQPDEEIDELETLAVRTKSPRMLITVSASTKIRDELRLKLRTSLSKDITLRELDYQPSD
ncbi:hypothetical protein VC83_07152 [Pseudogymnoascus destructans]|uniref:Uncharacterized protein n=1 Tax=Pseudogymnoascus destructans TaxID=655981 RepID=A0A177A3K4_9PEZI|nr:uncharacterized protein VC83_07152 [Pseudogymnoascus destructans]OAF56687.1 hypothetical protein VC83_07152 [Pseudogymnoascus destructans]